MPNAYPTAPSVTPAPADDGRIATVRVYDYARRRAFTMPAAELAAGMVRVHLDGVDGVDGGGEVWVDADDLRPGRVVSRTLSPDLRGRVERVYDALRDVLNAGGTDSAALLDGFRRDADPVAEVEVWEHLAWVYQRVVGLADLTLARRCGAFNLLLACSMSPDGPTPGLRHAADCKGLSLPQREAVIDLYYLGGRSRRRAAA